ncbi:tracheal-prostasin [Carabus blaptoides fortunei]
MPVPSNQVTTVILVILSAVIHISIQQINFVDDPNPSYNPNNQYELPLNITIPSPTSEPIISELNEVDRNRTGLLQWLLGIAGLTTPAPDIPQPPKNCSACACGIANKHRRIVGGQETEKNEFTWVVLLRYGSKFYCGASLINDKYLLTAAHCVKGFERDRISALFLEHDRTKPDETVTFTRTIQKVIRHENYNSRSYDNDIALLKLNYPVPLDNQVRPVCLPPAGESFAGMDGVIMGWGAIKEGGPLSGTLQEVSVPIITNEECGKTAYGSTRITENMLCAGFPKGGRDSCQGDSGGPMHVILNDIYHEAGVVSWGEGCAAANRPGVYTRVNNYLHWIRENTIDGCYC